MKTPHDPHRRTLGWLLATLTGGSLLMISGTGCSSTPAADDTEVGDIEVHVPTQAEADASAKRAITADNADAELQKLDDEVAADN